MNTKDSKKKFKVVFMGTPQFAVPCLESLLACEDVEVVGVVTQPDKKQGRGNKIIQSAIKERALQSGIPVLQPIKIRNTEEWQRITDLQPDIMIVVAYGQILPKELLEWPRFGCINVHGSLLPAYRGAAPMQYAILNGDMKTGITIMHMDVGMDTGNMIAKEEVDIDCEETLGSLHDKMMFVGANLLIKTLGHIFAGCVANEPQCEELVSYSPRISKEDERIDWTKSAEKIANLVRALNPAPGAYTTINGKRMKIWRSKVHHKAVLLEQGSVTHITSESFFVSTGDGELEILEVQSEGSKKNSAGDYVRGSKLKVGDKFE